MNKKLITAIALTVVAVITALASWTFLCQKNPLNADRSKNLNERLENSSEMEERQKLIDSLRQECASVKQNFSTVSLFDQYREIKEKYDKNSYTNCVCSSMNLAESYRKNPEKYSQPGSLPNDKVAVLLYELQASCLYGQKKTELAIATLESAIIDMGEKISEEDRATLELRIGNIYRGSNLYSKALAQFQYVENKYKEIFPDRFSRYAEENAEEILEQKVSQISGRIMPEDNSDCSGIRILARNGFNESETETSADCSYSLPLFGSTAETKVILYAIKSGYEPGHGVITFDGSEEIFADPLVLKSIKEKGLGIVMGTAYGTIVGGEIKHQQGIESVQNKHKVEIYADGNNPPTSVFSNDNGQYLAYFAPGSYWVMKGGKKYQFTIKEKETQLIDFEASRVLVD